MGIYRVIMAAGEAGRGTASTDAKEPLEVRGN